MSTRTQKRVAAQKLRKEELGDAVSGLVRLLTQAVRKPPKPKTPARAAPQAQLLKSPQALCQYLMQRMRPELLSGTPPLLAEPLSSQRNASLHLRVCYYIVRNKH